MPLAAVVRGLWVERGSAFGANTPEPMPRLFLETIAYAGGVGFLATALSLGPAWLVRAKGWRAAPLLLVPLFSPSYLAYSGWQLLRSPGTWLGDWIERQTATSDFAALTFGKGLAVGGLSLWAWPIAMLLLVPAFRRVDDETLEALRLDGASTWGRAIQVLRMARGGLVVAWAGVTLLMLGSAVPFHLAQVPTYAVQVWAQLAEQPGRPSVWVFSWPVIVICVVAAWALARSQTRHREAEEIGWPERASAGWSACATGVVWMLAVAGPLGLFAGHLHSWTSVVRFLQESAQALVQSGIVSGFVATGTMALVVFAWWSFAAGRAGSIWSGVGLGLLLFGMILPGVLVGSAVLRAVTEMVAVVPAVDQLQDGLGALIWGHLTRFGGLGVLVGGMIAWTEARDVRDMRGLDGCGWWRGAWEFVLRPNGGVVLAAGIASGLMSLYEIEATILLIPPGPGSLSHSILGFLHFARDEQLCAAGVSVVGSGVALAMIAALLARTSLATRARPELATDRGHI